MTHEGSGVCGCGWGCGHMWVRMETYSNNQNRYAVNTRYSCASCGQQFRHYYHTIPDIHLAMYAERVFPVCKKIYTKENRHSIPFFEHKIIMLDVADEGVLLQCIQCNHKWQWHSCNGIMKIQNGREFTKECSRGFIILEEEITNTQIAGRTPELENNPNIVGREIKALKESVYRLKLELFSYITNNDEIIKKIQENLSNINRELYNQKTTNELQFKLLTPTALKPTRGTSCSAGWDFYIDEIEQVEDFKFLIHTGVACQIPFGYVGILKDKSRLAKDTFNKVVGGVIDSDYRGEIIFIIENSIIHRPNFIKGTSCGQMIIVKQYVEEGYLVDNFTQPLTERVGGFGSTDTNNNNTL